MSKFKKTILADIDGTEYALCFGFGTMMAAEEVSGISVLQMTGSGSLCHYATLFHAVLQPQHPMSREEAVNLIDRAGITRVVEWIGEGVKVVFGKVSDDEPDAEAAAKPKRKKAA